MLAAVERPPRKPDPTAWRSTRTQIERAAFEVALDALDADDAGERGRGDKLADTCQRLLSLLETEDAG